MDNIISISVITPFYYGNKYMKKLSLTLEKNYQELKKVFSNVEMDLVIVNDSPSEFVDLQNIKVGFEYRIIKHIKNSGIHQARVTGLNYCKGDYVLFLDQDDELVDNAIAEQLEQILRENADIVICNAYIEEKKDRFLLYKTKNDYTRLTDLNFYLKSHNVIKSPGQCLIRKECIPIEWKKYIMLQNGSDDLFLWILMLEKSYKFILNKKPLYIHKYTGENLSESEEKMNISSLEIVDILRNVEYIPDKDIYTLEKSRKFSYKLRKGTYLEKCYLIFKNIDLCFYLVINKLKRIIY